MKNQDTTQACPNCGCARESWATPEGVDGKYCCADCAAGRECTCGCAADADASDAINGADLEKTGP